MKGPKNCPHEVTEFVEGNYVPPFGWEQYPGHFCIECGESVEVDEDDVEDFYGEGE